MAGVHVNLYNLLTSNDQKRSGKRKEIRTVVNNAKHLDL